MNADTTALQERIARILNDEGWTFEGVHEPGDYDECEDCRLAAAPIAARIAQEITAEVQAAKAEALDGLIAWHRESAQDAETPAPVRRGIAVMADEAQRYRDTHYPTPEETP